MFGLSFPEIVVILVVMVIVVGPERLPKVVRTLGHLWGRAQRYVNNVKADIARDMAAEDLQKLQQQMQRDAENARLAMQQAANVAGQQSRELSDAVTGAARSVSVAVEKQLGAAEKQLGSAQKQLELTPPAPSQTPPDQ
jgi:sec-independent protein translocase protein TatB